MGVGEVVRCETVRVAGGREEKDAGRNASI